MGKCTLTASPRPRPSRIVSVSTTLVWPAPYSRRSRSRQRSTWLACDPDRRLRPLTERHGLLGSPSCHAHIAHTWHDVDDKTRNPDWRVARPSELALAVLTCIGVVRPCAAPGGQNCMLCAFRMVIMLGATVTPIGGYLRAEVAPTSRQVVPVFQARTFVILRLQSWRTDVDRSSDGAAPLPVSVSGLRP